MAISHNTSLLVSAVPIYTERYNCPQPQHSNAVSAVPLYIERYDGL
jgi:hypothetical protein